MSFVNATNNQFIQTRVNSNKGVTCSSQNGGGYGSTMSSLKKSVLELIDDLGMKDPTTIKRQTTHAIAKLGYDDLYLVHNLRKRIAARISSLKALVKE